MGNGLEMTFNDSSYNANIKITEYDWSETKDSSGLINEINSIYQCLIIPT